MQLKIDALLDLFAQRGGVAALGPLIGELAQVVGLKLDAVQVVVSAQLLDLGLGILLRQHHIAVLVAGKLVKKLLLGDAPAILLLSTEILRDGKVGHDGLVVDGVSLHLVDNLHRIGDGLGDIGK